MTQYVTRNRDRRYIIIHRCSCSFVHNKPITDTNDGVIGTTANRLATDVTKSAFTTWYRGEHGTK